jgi:hypothetical protein
MTRRWLQSADVEINEATGALAVEGDVNATTVLPTSLSGGEKTVATAGAAEPLVATSTPCQFVWIGARVGDDGVASNSGACFIGNATKQHIPITKANFEGVIIHIDDAAKLYVRAVNSGDGVVYHIFA